MNFKITVSSYFAVEAKRLNKKYRSFAEDLRKFQESLLENPLQGVELSPGIRKIRLTIKSKGKGKSGGARVITYNILTAKRDGQIVLLLLYDKKDASSVNLSVIKKIIKDLDFTE